jgi:hypothetical protein
MAPPCSPPKLYHTARIVITSARKGLVYIQELDEWYVCCKADSCRYFRLLATLVHIMGHLAVTGLVAWLVYRKFGLALLRKSVVQPRLDLVRSWSPVWSPW